MDVDKQILMEAGTNELEILVFGIGDELFGMNIAKVREVIHLPELTKPPQVHPIVEGVLELREHILPIINLRRALSYPSSDLQHSDRIIVTEYHQQWFGFIVNHVQNIYRISWKDIEPVTDDHQSKSITGIAHVEEKLVMMLDLETITVDFSSKTDVEIADESSEELLKQRSAKRIIIADDSSTIRALIQDNLKRSGYTDLTITRNGEEAWNCVQAEKFDMLITDIEMPRMDGLHLTKLIKSNENYKSMPVLIFSSIISVDNRKKGEVVGADLQLAKPEINLLIASVDKFMGIPPKNVSA